MGSGAKGGDGVLLVAVLDSACAVGLPCLTSFVRVVGLAWLRLGVASARLGVAWLRRGVSLAWRGVGLASRSVLALYVIAVGFGV